MGSLPWDASYVDTSAGTFAVTIPATATANLPAGRYRWTAIVTGGGGYNGQRFTPESGVLTVTADPSQQGAGDAQTFAEKNLAAVEAVLDGRITADVEAYQIGGRSVTAIPIGQLMALRARLRDEVWRERNPGQPLPGVKVAFTVTR